VSAAPFPVAWTIAGSDSGGGAGLQADLRAFDAFDVHGCSAVTAITAQNSVRVQAIDAVSPELLDAQLQVLAADMPPAAIKTGLLGSVDNLRVVVRWVDRLREQRPEMGLVVDPVLRSTTGAVFADEAMLHTMRSELLPRATLVTPNRAEAAALLAMGPLRGERAVEQAAQALRALGSQAAVITGGDSGGDSSDDYAASALAAGWLSLTRIATPHHHGTGCVFASSAAAALARGFVATEAIVLAKMATTHSLRHGYAAGEGAGPVRPRADFSLDSGNLPAWSETRQPNFGNFAPLSDPHLGLYAVVDSAAWVRRVLEAGARTVQLRIKDPHHRNCATRCAQASPPLALLAPSYSSTITGRLRSKRVPTACTSGRRTSSRPICRPSRVPACVWGSAPTPIGKSAAPGHCDRAISLAAPSTRPRPRQCHGLRKETRTSLIGAGCCRHRWWRSQAWMWYALPRQCGAVRPAWR